MRLNSLPRGSYESHRHRRDAVSLLQVHAGCCHFIYPFLFDRYFVSIGIKLNTGQKRVK
jgi:hypothetical protein